MGTSTALKSALVTAAALASALGLAASASATGTWTVSGVPASGTIVAYSTNMVLTDSSTGVQFTCATAVLTVTATNGGGQSGAPFAQVTSATWSNCHGPVGLPLGITAQNLPWDLDAVGYNATTGVVTGTLNDFETHFSLTGCNADFRGTSATTPAALNVTYTNPSHTLRLPGTGNLHSYNVSGTCVGLINNGDSVAFKSDYVLSAPVVITSP